MTLTEGRNRQVRRMIEAVGGKVLKLTRIRIGPIAIGDLKIGRWRELTAAELTTLRSPRKRRSEPRPCGSGLLPCKLKPLNIR
jgi:16S rRNA U516 pseudouridylate synthase RsuA-like enzyme